MKKCPNCGSMNHEANYKCSCGHEFDHETIKQSQKNMTENSESERPNNDSSSRKNDADQIDGELDKYKGIKGWLLFICIYLTIINPLGFSFLMMMKYSESVGINGFSWDFFFNRRIPGMETYTIISLCLDIGVLVFSIVTGILLWKVKPSSIKFAKKFLLTMIAVSFFTFFLPYLVGLPKLVAGSIATANFYGLLKTMIIISIGFSYLNKSKRIRANYEIKY